MSLLAQIVLIAAAAVVGLVCLRRFPPAGPPPPRRDRQPPLRAPEQLRTNEMVVSTSRANALQAHAYLRPVLVEVAADRLRARGLNLRQMSAPARAELLGEPLAELVRPGRPLPADRHGPGVSDADLEAMVKILEGL